MITKSIIVNKPTMNQNQGIARAVECANSYKSYLVLSSGDVKMNAKSLLGILALQISEGMSLEIIADGPDEVQAIEALASHLCN